MRKLAFVSVDRNLHTYRIKLPKFDFFNLHKTNLFLILSLYFIFIQFLTVHSAEIRINVTLKSELRESLPS